MAATDMDLHGGWRLIDRQSVRTHPAATVSALRVIEVVIEPSGSNVPREQAGSHDPMAMSFDCETDELLAAQAEQTQVVVTHSSEIGWVADDRIARYKVGRP
jgi:hypothetical protein